MISRAKQVILIEASAIRKLADRIDNGFLKAVRAMELCKGHVVVCGMGKTGIIGRKISATLSSTGTPSLFLHSAEAVHGDLGQVKAADVVVLISQSGETEETIRLLPLIKKIGAKIIAITGGRHSALARHSDFFLDASVREEGCPLGLAPMASTTAILVMGDALAACLIERKRFKQEDFAFFHPGGSLGRRLLLKVEHIMRKKDSVACVNVGVSVKEALWAITRARAGAVCIVDKNNKLLGIFTDGDLRRHLEKDVSVINRKIDSLMTRSPLVVQGTMLAADAFILLKSKKIDELPVVDGKGKLEGMLDVQDLLKAGLI